MCGAGTFVMVFMQLEIRQHLVPGPRVVPAKPGPLVVITRLTAHVDHAVDAAAPTQRFATRIAQRTAIQARLRLGVVKPVRARVANAVQIAHRNMNPVVVVLASGFNQQHALARIGREPIGQQATRRAGTDDDVVEGSAHACPVFNGRPSSACVFPETPFVPLWHRRSG